MARDFDGVDDIIKNTSITTFSGSYTMAGWINADSAAEGLRIIETARSSDGLGERGLIVQTGFKLEAFQGFTTEWSDSVSTQTLTVGVWYCVVATYTSSDKKMRMYYGSLSAPMAEMSYSLQTAGVGTIMETSVRVMVGSTTNGETNRDFDGRIEHAFCDNRIWTLDEMEAFRQGQRPINTGSMIFYWPLDSPTAAQAEDLSGNGYHGTVTGAIAAEGPPVAMRWGDSFGVTYTAAVAGGAVLDERHYPRGVARGVLRGVAA